MRWLERLWYSDTTPPVWLRLLERLYLSVVARRAQAYKQGKQACYSAPVPVIVVGNITVGGTGKTPVVIWLIEQLRSAGYTPGVVSRGYGGKAPYYPYSVGADTDPGVSGDEPAMIVQRTGVPLVVAPDRSAAVRYLLENSACDLVISDDGLQHHALGRDVELVVIDAQRMLGNGHCLPAGPLREPASRLEQVDFIIGNGGSLPIPGACAMQLAPTAFVSLVSGERTEIADWPHKTVHAVAGIGNPKRFFDTLRQSAGIIPKEHPFPDHHDYRLSELCFDDGLPVVMTEKDAVKAQHAGIDHGWYLEVSAIFPPDFSSALVQKIDLITRTVEDNG